MLARTDCRSSPWAIAHDGIRLLVVERFSQSVAVFDKHGNLMARVAVGHAPAAIALAPGGETVHILCHYGNELLTLPGSFQGEAVRHPTGALPLAVAPLSDGTLVVAASGDRALNIFASDGSRTDVALPSSPMDVAVLTDDDVVVATTDGLAVVDIRATRITRWLPGDPSARRLAVAPDRRHIWVTENYRGEIAIVDLSSFEVVQRIAQAAPWAVAITGTETALVSTYPPTDETGVREWGIDGTSLADWSCTGVWALAVGDGARWAARPERNCVDRLADR